MRGRRNCGLALSLGEIQLHRLRRGLQLSEVMILVIVGQLIVVP